MIGTYTAIKPAGLVDDLTLNIDSTYSRQFVSSDGRRFLDHGRWYLHLLGSRQNSPYIKLQLDQFVTHYLEDTTSGQSIFDPVPGGVPDSVPFPREARIWKRVAADSVTIRIGNLIGPAWLRNYRQ